MGIISHLPALEMILSLVVLTWNNPEDPRSRVESNFIFNFTSTVNSEHLKIMYTNVDSLMNKRDELRALIQNKSYDVIALKEILPKNKIQKL